MCGITGFIDHSLKEPQASTMLTEMLNAISHRGPDARGHFYKDGVALGHNRLSIIDLSHEADQPMIDDELIIVFNGEIYNYIELRNELVALGYQFKTQSDTEVILKSYRAWKEHSVEKFIGMWSFVILDASVNLVFASRDRFGIKPFYYIAVNDKLYFASEFKALKVCPLYTNEINVAQVARGLQMGWLGYEDQTYFSKIQALPAAHNLLIQLQDGKISRTKISRYWDIEAHSKNSSTFDSKAFDFYKLFNESVRIHMRSDVPLASCLSGGLDSSAIVSVVQSQNPEIRYKSFSIYYDGNNEVDERPFIEEVLSKYPAIDPVFKKPSDAEVVEEFHKALFHCDVPATGSSFISQYFLMKLIAESGIKVVLDGQGSDEYLAGYMHSHYRAIGENLRKLRLTQALGQTLDLRSRLGMTPYSTLKHFGKSLLAAASSEQSLYALEFNRYFPNLLKAKPDSVPFNLKQVGGSRLDQFLYHLIFTTSLPALLHYEDRNSMAFSIESRVPFLDHRLVEFAFSLSDEDRINKNETKYVLRQALRDVLPEKIRTRRDKKGFVTPGENKWLRGPLRHTLELDYSKMDFLDTGLIRKLVKEYQEGDNSRALLIWRIATLNYWIKHFV